MRSKILAATAIAGLMMLGGSAAAHASGVDYPAAVSCTANPASVAVGATSTVTCEGFMPGSSVSFSASGGTVASLVFASAGGVTKTADDSGAASASFSSNAAGSFTVTASGTAADESAVSGSATVTVTAAGSDGGDELPATGGTSPAAALWLGIGALGLGGIAVTAAVARRRAAAQR